MRIGIEVPFEVIADVCAEKLEGDHYCDWLALDDDRHFYYLFYSDIDDHFSYFFYIQSQVIFLAPVDSLHQLTRA